MIYEEAIKQMLEGNQLLIRRAIDGAHYDSTKVGVVISDGTNEGYKIKVGSLEYDNVDSLNNAIYTPNQIVMVTMPQNSLGDMYITGAIGSSPVGGGSSSGSGGDGTTNYLSLSNKPKINGVTLSGNISGTALGLLDSSAVSDWAKSDTKPTYTAEEVGALPDTTEIPTKTSDLVNDSGFITTIPTYSDLSNKPQINGVTLTGNITGNTLGLLETSDISEWAKSSTKPTYTASEVGALPNTTTIPSKTSDLTNDSGFITSVPTATSSQLGVVKVDGETITINNGVISSVGGGDEYVLPTATASTLGGVKVDNNTITINNGVISAGVGSTKFLPFNDTYVSSCDTYATNGYIKVSMTATANASKPTECQGTSNKSGWGILFFIAENAENGTGTQMYFPIDGTYKGKVYTRGVVNLIKGTKSLGTWERLATIGDVGSGSSSGTSDYTALTNKPSINGVTLQGSQSLSDLGISIPTNVSDLTNDSGYITDTQVSDWLNGIDIKYDETTAKPMWRPRGGTDYSPFGDGDGGGLSFTSEYRYGTTSSVSVTSSSKTTSVTFDQPMSTSNYNVLVSPTSNVCVSVYSRTKTTLTLSVRARSSTSGVGTYTFNYLVYK